LVELARPQPEWRVLDVGTGTGHTALAFAPYVQEVIGVDLTEEMLQEAAGLARERGVHNVSFREADVHRLPQTFDASFELVTCRRVAHHFSDIERAVSEMARTLRPGGLLLIDDRSVPEDDWIDETMHRLDCLHDASHVASIGPALTAAGLSVEALGLYTKHRPVSSLTDRVVPGDVEQIHAILNGLSTAERAKLRLEMVNGELRPTHWYVLVAARAAATDKQPG